MYITPDDLIDGLPGMQLLSGYNTDGGIISIWSPGHVLLVDPLGRRTGMDSNGMLHEEIPDALWTLSPYNESVSASHLADDWTIEVSGYGTGTYSLLRTSAQVGGPSFGTVGFIRPGEKHVFEVGGIEDLQGSPAAVDDSATTTTGSPIVVDVLANDVDLDGDLSPGTLQVVVAPTHGSALVAGGSIRYTPVAAFTGADSFAYSVCDLSANCSSGQVSVTVRPSVTADKLTVHIYWGAAAAKTLAYANNESLTSGDYVVAPALGKPTAITGTGTIPSKVSGDASITLSLTFASSTRTWSGNFLVADVPAGFSASVPIHAGPLSIIRMGNTTKGVIWGIKSMSTPMKCFKIVFEIRDLNRA
jgi:hypothetical protein